MENWLKCQISTLDKYRQNKQKQTVINVTVNGLSAHVY